MQINRPRISLLILSILALSVVTPTELTAVEKRKPRWVPYTGD